ncbi:TPA: hypothetical protein ACIBS5_002875 [Salmonella enterica subsp. diarizonae serovar 60-67:z35:-]
MENPEHKEIEVSPEVKKELREISERIHELCKENNIPLVLAFIDERKKAGDGMIINKYRCAYLNYDSGAWDSSLFVASCFAELNDIPLPVVDMVLEILAFCKEDEAEENSTGNNLIH